MKKKVYYNIYQIKTVWEVIDDLELIGLKIVGMARNCVVVEESQGYNLWMIDKIMAKRGFF